jgi:hypothetical protein
MYKSVLAVLLAAGTVMAICQTVNPSKNEGGQTAAGSPSGGAPAPANNAAPASDPVNAGAKGSAPINSNKIPSGSKLFVAPMGGFENYVIAGILKKKVAVTIVADRDKAEYEIRGSAETEKAGWAKMLFLGSQNSNEQASINVSEIKTGNVVFAYSVNKLNSVRGKQSAGEAIGKHLNEAIGKD